MPNLSQIGKEIWEVRLEIHLEPLVKYATWPIFTKSGCKELLYRFL